MDTLECISVETSLDDELAFLKFVCKNRNIRMISTHATFEGPIYLAPDDLPMLKQSHHTDTFLLWNTRIANPLCWELYRNHRYADRSKSSHLKKHGNLESFAFFQHRPITEEIFKNGRINTLLSPVVEVSVPTPKRGYFMITAEFCNWLNGIWVVWDNFEQRWKHENRNLQKLFENCRKQPDGFIQWQESLFDWIKKNWASKILKSESYRY